jgi:hypothetical protein
MIETLTRDMAEGTAEGVERLNAADPVARAEYERACYAAYERVSGNRLIRKLWRWDDAARRVAARIPYEDQVVYILRDGRGRISRALAVNVGMRELQSAAYGFPPPAPASCEFLSYVSGDDHQLLGVHEMWRESFADLRARGFGAAVATSAAQPLPFYRRAGAEVLAEAEIEGEQRYFLRFDLARTRTRPVLARAR